MNLLLMIMVFALGVALAKHVVKIGLKLVSLAGHMARALLILLFLMVVVGALTPVILSIA